MTGSHRKIFGTACALAGAASHSPGHKSGRNLLQQAHKAKVWGTCCLSLVGARRLCMWPGVSMTVLMGRRYGGQAIRLSSYSSLHSKTDADNAAIVTASVFKASCSPSEFVGSSPTMRH